MESKKFNFVTLRFIKSTKIDTKAGNTLMFDATIIPMHNNRPDDTYATTRAK